MICITGNEATVGELHARLLAHPAAFHEIRLDALRDSFDEAINLIGGWPRSIVCCRPSRCGGAWTEGETERRQLLRRAAKAGAAWIDIEHDALEVVPELRAGSTSMLGSFHDFRAMPENLGEVAAQIASSGCDALKIAVQVSDATELTALRRQLLPTDIPKVVVAMGSAGQLSRIRYRLFGSLWTYVAASEATATAEGQLTLSEAEAAGLPETAAAPFVALIGDSRIAASPGPRVYNRLFRSRQLPWSYVGMETLDPIRSLDLLRELGALGAGVTIPHKKTIAAGTKPDAIAVRAGAANSVRVRGEIVESTNTDVGGVARPLASAMSTVPVRTALILGRGGAAAAARVACEDLGLAAINASGESWERRAEIDADVLINATPIVDASVWPENMPLGKKIVFDMAIGAAESPLLVAAREQGAVTIGPREMWVEQGAAQMSWITGVPVSPAELRTLLD